MRKLFIALGAVLALAVPSVAAAGGWATVGLTPPSPPGGSGPGDEWVADVTVLQHGETPLAGVKPVLTLTSAENGKRLEFPARPTGEVGVYRVVVELPAKGTWELAVYDGFGEHGGAQTHTFAPITVGAPSAPVASPPAQQPVPAPAPAEEAFPTALVVAAALLGTIGTAAVVVLARRSRRKTAAVV